MARNKQTAEAQPSTEIVPSNGTLTGSKAARRSQPTHTEMAFRDVAAGLGAYFARTDNGQESDMAALKYYMGWGDNPWEIIGRGETKNWNDVYLKADAVLNEIEDMEEYKEWKENCPMLQGPPGFVYLQLVGAYSMELKRQGRLEALEFGTGVIAPDLHRASGNKKD